MWTALLAFVGGVAAVGLKGWVDYLLERRRERRAVQIAARLVYEELWHASAAIGTEPFPEPDTFTEAAWDEHKLLIGSALDFESWRLVLSGYYALGDARSLCEEALDGASSREPGRAEQLRSQLLDSQHSIGIARDIVGELIKGHEWDPFPAYDEAYERHSEVYERRRRRSRLLRKLSIRIRYWLGRETRAGSKTGSN